MSLLVWCFSVLLLISFLFHTIDVGSLEVYIMGESEFIDDIQPVFVKVGNQGDEWRRGEIYIDKRDEPYQVRLQMTNHSINEPAHQIMVLMI